METIMSILATIQIVTFVSFVISNRHLEKQYDKWMKFSDECNERSEKQIEAYEKIVEDFKAAQKERADED